MINLQQEQYDSDKQYWHDSLSNLSAGTFFQSKSSGKEKKVIAHTVKIKDSLCRQIKQSLNTHGNLLNIFLSSLGLLAYKYTNSSSVSIGCYVAYQDTMDDYHKNSENFTNLIVFNTTINAEDCIGNMINRTQHKLHEILKHSRYPFHSLIDELKIDLSVNPPFYASIKIHDQYDVFIVEQQSLHIFGGIHFDIFEAENEYLISLKFDAMQFEDWQIQSLIESYKNILGLITREENLKLPIKDVELLYFSEREILVNNWSWHHKPHFPYERIEQAFIAICSTRRDKVALEYNGRYFTYNDLDLWSDQVARALICVTTKDVIALCMQKSVELIVAIIAALKAGMTYLSIDPNYPMSRIEYMLQDSQCQDMLVTNKITLSSLGVPVNLIQFDKLHDSGKDSNQFKLRGSKNPVACIIYTSGSTGHPKPVMVAHKSIVNLLVNQLNYFKIDSSDRMLQFSSISFDASISEMWIPLLSGAVLVIPQDRYLSGELLEKTIIEQSISAIIIPPTILDTIVDPAYVRPFLKTVVCAGEALTRSTAEKWAKNIKNFINAYGPSETTVCATFCFYDQNNSDENVIGKPLDGVSVYILNSDLTLTPIGCVGELYIGGAGVSPGYYNHPELDVGRFIENPFDRSQGRIYKTGDLSKWLCNGNIQYIGRIDRQVKFNGIRVELEEIENQLSGHPAINLCAICIESNDINQEKQLVAYFTKNSAYAINLLDIELKQSIREYLLARLPLSIVPHKYIMLSDFPRLPNGKINRDKLKDSIHELSVKVNVVSSLFSETEKEIAKIYANILKIDINNISSQSNFFDLGATSLHAISALVAINEKLSLSLTIEDFFSASDVGYLAKKAHSTDDDQSKKRVNELVILYQKCLGLDPSTNIDTHLSFFDLGGTSLSAIKLLSEFKNNYSMDLSIDDFFSKSSIDDLVKVLDGNSAKNTENTDDFQQNELEDDLFFDIESLSSGEILITTSKYSIKNILLTGVTGFLGSYLLESLLRNTTDTVVHCLIRNGKNKNLFNRLVESLKQYNITGIDFSRIKLYESDLSKEALGLSEENYAYLAEHVDSIYHCAAAVNHVYSYGMLRKANVLGTIEIIKLAAMSKRKVIHYISALDIALAKEGCNTFQEERSRIQNEMGYIQTKWVSEYLLDKAASLLGLFVRIYRPGNIIGDLKKGVMDPHTNHFLMFIKGCIELGVGPDSHFLIEMTPVDIVSESIVKLATQENDKDFSVYNLHNPNYISWEEYAGILNNKGYAFSLIDSVAWINDHLAHINSEHTLFPLKNYYMTNNVRLNSRLEDVPYIEVKKLLNDFGIVYPMDYALINHAYLKQLQEIEFL